MHAGRRGGGKRSRATARIRQMMHELGNQEHGATHHLRGVQSPYSWSAPRQVLAVGKLRSVLPCSTQRKTSTQCCCSISSWLCVLPKLWGSNLFSQLSSAVLSLGIVRLPLQRLRLTPQKKKTRCTLLRCFEVQTVDYGIGLNIRRLASYSQLCHAHGSHHCPSVNAQSASQSPLEADVLLRHCVQNTVHL